MCITAHLSYKDCRCTIHRYYICHSHIRHTWHQKDNNPCPYTAVRHILLNARACNDPFATSFHEEYAPLEAILVAAAAAAQHGGRSINNRPLGCSAVHADEYNFATKILKRSDMRFLELGEGGYMSEACRSGNFMWDTEHTCGLGRRVGCSWAHLNPHGKVLDPKAQNTLEELAVEEIMSRSRREVQRKYDPTKHSAKVMKTIEENSEEESDFIAKQERLQAIEEELRFIQVEVERYLRFRKYMAAVYHEMPPTADEVSGLKTVYKVFEEKVGPHTALLAKKEADRVEKEYEVRVKKLQVFPESIMNDEEADFAAEYASENGFIYAPKVKEEELDMDITTISMVDQWVGGLS